MLNRDFEWKSGGKVTKIRDMSDTYLINVIAYVKTCRVQNESNKKLLEFLLKEAIQTRKLTKQFIDMGPFPFKTPDGNWAVCDRNKYRIYKLSNKVQDDKNLEFVEDILTEDSLSDRFIYETNEVIKSLKNILKI